MSRVVSLARWVLSSIVIIGAGSAAMAEDRTVVVIGRGSEPCAAWTASRPDGYSAGYGDWLLGYISGVNVWGPTARRDLVRNRNGREMIEWIDVYCRDHPNEEIELAARQLVLALGRRAREEEAQQP